MNKIRVAFFLCLCFLQFQAVSAQEFKVGLKGGINKTFGGSITGIKSADIYTDDTFDAEGEIGFHGGAWGQVNFGKFFVRPEVVYSALESRFDFPNRPSLYQVKELSIPVLVGYNIYGPLDIYGGVAYKNIIDATLEGDELNDQIVVQNTPASVQFGAKVEFGSFGLDVRYDYALSSAENQEVDIINSTYGINRGNFTDARLNQLIVSLTLKLWDSKESGNKRRRGGSCYF
ncbi:porin family protein [Gillisia sp. M10.2A]|uniref:Porin family protein n=1 Tax=Gillisia lutea TaxID=2909668 RepID=A0ABS9EHZ8_9FLAO|nr:porin family protein [Gillisia lutea]MCF4102471.1 porin family protein [Gillisia lutea]